MTPESLSILMTDPHLSGGGQIRYVINLASELTALGHQVTIGCKPNSLLARRTRENGREAHDRFIFRGGLRPRTWIHDLVEAKRYLRECHPDIIHVSGSQDHWICALANRSMGSPICLVRTRHNTYPVSGNLPNRLLNRTWTTYQIVVCEIVRRDLARNRAFDPARMCSIHNGVDAEAFKPDPEARAAARAEFGYTDDHLVCGIAARLTPAKGHQFLLKAITQLQPSHPHLRVLALGQGDLEEPLKQMARELGIVEKVHFAGFRDDMARCTQAFDLGIQPSIDCDTSSFSLKEQMAAAKPVIASDYGGLPEILTEGIEGRLVPAGAIEPLRDALRDLADQPNLRAEMGAAGRARVLRDFTVQVFAQQTVEAYRRALEIHREAKASHR